MLEKLKCFNEKIYTLGQIKLFSYSSGPAYIRVITTEGKTFPNTLLNYYQQVYVHLHFSQNKCTRGHFPKTETFGYLTLFT